MSDQQTATKRSTARKRSSTKKSATPAAEAAPVETPVEEAPAPAEKPAEAPQTEPDGLAVMQSLYGTLLGRVKDLGAEITEKAAYARVRVPAGGKLTTVVYVNHPSRKTVRLEFPNGSGGYEVVKVEDEAGVEAAFNRIEKDAAALAAA